ncbi:death-associated inhibitor of apoptosis 2-like [Sitophilus oryzae]|uniref:Death-associated inhibitor of apoptosis 2-like n=1 Tax=Sitophilus oryzae TaxID=7048 RepID=A0A6J2YYS3_SITOR|nr:death-associated inhibitor of apoptosis 2-like [Sitophilus oryzae]XP_030767988.1 death-associated inhibitor of apoptosis 2-like [Sitophilus oryzae]XP_030767995.1 death-associated inhibitor of apoptosis 2-like [Sitophilus oryzae]
MTTKLLTALSNIPRNLSEADNGPKASQEPPSDTSSSGSETSTSTDFRKYISYEQRLKTFDSWPNQEVSKESLASAGFFYKQRSDIVQCPYCNIEGYQWVAGDDPVRDHRTWSPHCPFVMTMLEHDNQDPREPARDTCGLYGLAILPNSVPEDEVNLERLGIQKTKGPSHPDKFLLETRLATFKAWPKSMRQTPKQLSEAGFFYVGVGDQTLCFHCGGGLKDWEASDDPWEQHAIWFPKCQYLFLKKGPDYIKEMEKRRNPLPVSSDEETKEEASSQTSEKSEDSAEPISDGESKTLCKVCYKNEVGVLFLPCGHIVSCVECAPGLKKCPMCRKPLEGTVRAFLS